MDAGEEGRRLGLGTLLDRWQVDEVLAVGGHQLARALDGAEVMLLQDRSRFLHPLAEPLGGFQLLVVATPLGLPMQGEPTQGQHAKAETNQGAVGGAMEASQQG